MQDVTEMNLFNFGDCSPNYFPECLAAYWLWRTLPFCLLVIGTAGNILNIAILTRANLRRRSTSVFLLFLAVSDLLVLWSDVPPSVIHSMTGYNIADTSRFACSLRSLLPRTCGSFTIWILALLTIERLLLIKLPTSASRYITSKNVFIISGITVSTITLVNSHLLFGFTLIKNDMFRYSTATNSTMNGTQETSYKCSFVSQGYAHFYEKKWSNIAVMIYAFIPTTLLVIGNISIVVALRMQAKRMNRSTGQTSSTNNTSMRIGRMRNLAATKLLIALSLYSLATMASIGMSVTVRRHIVEFTERDEAVWQLLTILVNIFVWSNNSLNFFFYFVRGSLFKDEWNRLISPLVRRIRNRVRPMQEIHP